MGGTNSRANKACTKYILFYSCELTLTGLCHSGRSKTKGKQAIQAVLELGQGIELQKNAIVKLETALAETSALNVVDVTEQLQDARQHLTRLECGFTRKRSALGVHDKADLLKLQKDAFLQLRMNALALKHRIRDRLRQRKFEIEKLERSYRRSTNGLYSWLIAL
jgi:hypothetical protein